MDLKTIVILITGIIVLAFMAGYIWYLNRGGDDDDSVVDDMEGQEFEEY